MNFSNWTRFLEDFKKARAKPGYKVPEKDKDSKHEFSNRTGQAQKH